MSSFQCLFWEEKNRAQYERHEAKATISYIQITWFPCNFDDMLAWAQERYQRSSASNRCFNWMTRQSEPSTHINKKKIHTLYFYHRQTKWISYIFLYIPFRLNFFFLSKNSMIVQIFRRSVVQYVIFSGSSNKIWLCTILRFLFSLNWKSDL